MRAKITINSIKDKTVKGAYDQFIRSKLAMNVSEATIDHYENSCKWFLAFTGDDFLCENITEAMLTDYLIYLKEIKLNMAPKTLQTYIRALRTLLYFFMKQGYTEKFDIKLPKAEETIKEVYTDYEIQCLIRKPNMKKCSFSELRDWAMICYFLATGNRLSKVTTRRALFLLRRFVEPEITLNCVVRLREALYRYPAVELRRIGFLEDWEALLQT